MFSRLLFSEPVKAFKGYTAIKDQQAYRKPNVLPSNKCVVISKKNLWKIVV